MLVHTSIWLGYSHIAGCSFVYMTQKMQELSFTNTIMIQEVTTPQLAIREVMEISLP